MNFSLYQMEILTKIKTNTYVHATLDPQSAY